MLMNDAILTYKASLSFKGGDSVQRANSFRFARPKETGFLPLYFKENAHSYSGSGVATV